VDVTQRFQAVHDVRSSGQATHWVPVWGRVLDNHKGHGKVIADGGEVDVEPGSIAYASAKSTHQIVNTGKETLHAYWILVPPGPEEALLKMMGKF